jgi:hypothetical protein
VTKYIQTVVTAPVAGQEQEFNRWYDHTHLPEVLALPGFVSAQRYELVGDRPSYLAVYELETDDIDATLEALTAGARTTMTRTDAMDEPATVVNVYRVLGERRTAEDSEGR